MPSKFLALQKWKDEVVIKMKTVWEVDFETTETSEYLKSYLILTYLLDIHVIWSGKVHH